MIYFILLFGLLLRLINLNQSLWLDEAINVLATQKYIFWNLVTNYSLGDFHPPLYHPLLAIWIKIFGAGEISSRFLSVIFGVFTIYFVYLIGRQLTKQAGIIAAFFMATSPLHIYYSQEARMYAMAAFAVCGSFYFFLKIIDSDKRVDWLGYLLFSLFVLYSDYLPYFIFLAQNLAVFFLKKKMSQTMFKKWILSQAILFVLLLPWLPFFLEQFKRATNVANKFPVWKSVVGGFSLKALPLTYVKFIIGRISLYNKALYAFLVSIPALTFAFLLLNSFVKRSKHEKIILIIFLWLLIPPITAFIISIKLAIFAYFRFIFLLPAFYLLLAYGALSLKSNTFRQITVLSIVVINLLCILVYYLNPRFQREDWRNLVSFIEANSKQTKTITVFVNRAQSAPYEYYAKTVPFTGPDKQNWFGYDTIWLMRYAQPIFDPSDETKTVISKLGYQKLIEKDFNGVVIWQYQK